ncbi:MAG TPA: rhodanese-like domain-containing protein [Acetobacteraceae bacterium]|nr:rhodanese-like domain-containing protein [Acetobacteraceae bacterium]
MVRNVSATETWRALQSDPDARLVDVRTKGEWQTVGVPDLSATGKETLLIEWQRAPFMRVNRGFLAALRAAGLSAAQPLFFICRSGVRSMAAAQLAEQAGYARCFNVADGFEGPADEQGLRGRLAGWQADGLPWRKG